MNDNIQEKIKLIASLIEIQEKNLQIIKETFNELMLLQKSTNSTSSTIKVAEDSDEILFEKVFLLYQRYSDLRLKARNHNISMAHPGGLSTFHIMYKKFNKLKSYKAAIKNYWFYGLRNKKQKDHEAFEMLSSFQRLLDTPNELITNQMLDNIILEDLNSHNATIYKGFNEFKSLMMEE